MIDPEKEEILSLEDAATYVRRKYGGRKPHPQTLRRWCISGQRGLLLESLKRGGPRVTSKEAVDRFFQRCAEPRAANAPPVPIPSMASLAAEQELIAQGF